MRLPDPALVVLVGASGSGKSTWAESHFRAQEVVSSDALRGIVGSGPHDLDASSDAFGVLETVVAARLGRGLTTVVDTLGLDQARRRAWLAQGEHVVDDRHVPLLPPARRVSVHVPRAASGYVTDQPGG